jgi:hypothetical protein
MSYVTEQRFHEIKGEISSLFFNYETKFDPYTYVRCSTLTLNIIPTRPLETKAATTLWAM